MTHILSDLKYLEAGLEVLEAYLLADGLYWPVGASAPAGEPDFPSLTLGGLLLARQRLSASALSGDQQTLYQSLSAQLDDVHQRWQVAWERKAQRSFHARVNQWRNFLVDYGSHPAEHASRYAYEVRLRVMLALLLPTAGAVDAAELELLSGLDQIVRARLEPGGFIWDAALAAAFPQPAYWYLYGALQTRLED